MQNVWTPLFSLAVFLMIFSAGDVISYKTKGLISSILVGSVVYLIGFWTNIIPADSVSSTYLPSILTSFVVALLLVNLGTAINLDQLISEWKTVLTAFIGLAGLAFISFTASTWLFGREYALSAASPIAGGTIAAIITQEAAVAAGKPEMGGFAMLVVSFQMFIGMPVASFLLKREATRMLSNRELMKNLGDTQERKIKIRIFPELAPQLQTTVILTCKVAMVAVLAYWIASATVIPGSNPTNYYLNPNIAYLLFGILFSELGFLEKGALQKANIYGFTMICMFTLAPNSFVSVTPAVFMKMLVPLIGTLVLGTLGIALFSAVAGKFLGYSVELSVAIGLTALLGYPSTQIITDEVVAALSASTEEKAAISDVLLPKMLVGGFATVTIASVIFAGIVTPLIF